MRVFLASLFYFFILATISACSKDEHETPKAPYANAGKDQFFSEPTNGVTLNGIGLDANGFIVSYRWRKVAGPAGFNITDSEAALTTLNLLELGIYQFEFKVIDNEGLYGMDTVAISIDSSGNPCNGCWDY